MPRRNDLVLNVDANVSGITAKLNALQQEVRKVGNAGGRFVGLRQFRGAQQDIDQINLKLRELRTRLGQVQRGTPGGVRVFKEILEEARKLSVPLAKLDKQLQDVGRARFTGRGTLRGQAVEVQRLSDTLREAERVGSRATTVLASNLARVRHQTTKATERTNKFARSMEEAAADSSRLTRHVKALSAEQDKLDRATLGTFIGRRFLGNLRSAGRAARRSGKDLDRLAKAYRKLTTEQRRNLTASGRGLGITQGPDVARFYRRALERVELLENGLERLEDTAVKALARQADATARVDKRTALLARRMKVAADGSGEWRNAILKLRSSMQALDTNTDVGRQFARNLEQGSKAITRHRLELRQLQRAYRRLDASQRRGEAGQELARRFAALQRRVPQLEASLRSLNSSLDRVARGGMSRLGYATQRAEERLLAFGERIGKAAERATEADRRVRALRKELSQLGKAADSAEGRRLARSIDVVGNSAERTRRTMERLHRRYQQLSAEQRRGAIGQQIAKDYRLAERRLNAADRATEKLTSSMKELRVASRRTGQALGRLNRVRGGFLDSVLSGGDTGGFVGGLRRVTAAIVPWLTLLYGTRTALHSVQSAFYAAGRAVRFLAREFEEGIRRGTDMYLTLRELRITVPQLQALSQVFEGIGLSADQASEAISEVIEQAGRATTGTTRSRAQARYLFTQLGIDEASLRELSNRPQELFDRVIAGFREIGSITERYQIAAQLLGEEFISLVSSLSEFEASMERANTHIRLFGTVTEDQAYGARRLNEDIGRLRNSWDSVRISLVSLTRPHIAKSLARLYGVLDRRGDPQGFFELIRTGRAGSAFHALANVLGAQAGTPLENTTRQFETLVRTIAEFTALILRATQPVAKLILTVTTLAATLATLTNPAVAGENFRGGRGFFTELRRRVERVRDQLELAGTLSDAYEQFVEALNEFGQVEFPEAVAPAADELGGLSAAIGDATDNLKVLLDLLNEASLVNFDNIPQNILSRTGYDFLRSPAFANAQSSLAEQVIATEQDIRLYDQRSKDIELAIHSHNKYVLTLQEELRLRSKLYDLQKAAGAQDQFDTLARIVQIQQHLALLEQEEAHDLERVENAAERLAQNRATLRAMALREARFQAMGKAVREVTEAVREFNQAFDDQLYEQHFATSVARIDEGLADVETRFQQHRQELEGRLPALRRELAELNAELVDLNAVYGERDPAATDALKVSISGVRAEITALERQLPGMREVLERAFTAERARALNAELNTLRQGLAETRLEGLFEGQQAIQGLLEGANDFVQLRPDFDNLVESMERSFDEAERLALLDGFIDREEQQRLLGLGAALDHVRGHLSEVVRVARELKATRFAEADLVGQFLAEDEIRRLENLNVSSIQEGVQAYRDLVTEYQRRLDRARQLAAVDGRISQSEAIQIRTLETALKLIEETGATLSFQLAGGASIFQNAWLAAIGTVGSALTDILIDAENRIERLEELIFNFARTFLNALFTEQINTFAAQIIGGLGASGAAAGASTGGTTVNISQSFTIQSSDTAAVRRAIEDARPALQTDAVRGVTQALTQSGALRTAAKIAVRS